MCQIAEIVFSQALGNLKFVVVCSDDPPETPEGATSDWDGSSKIVDTVITYTCDIAGPVTRAVCDAKSKTWIPSTIPSC